MTTPTPLAPPPATPKKPGNGVARIALIVAVVAFVLGLVPFVGFFSWVIALGAIVVAIIALTRRNLPKGMAVAGLIIGVVALIVGPSVAIGSVVGAVNGASDAAASGAAVAAAAAQPTSATETEAPADDTATEEPSEEPADDVVPTKTYNGSGDKVVKVEYEKPIIVKFSCSSCSGNTAVKTDSGTNTLPVNTIGGYSGRFLLNASDGDLLTRFVVSADSSWKLTIKDLTNASIERVEVGSTVKGHGDDVIVIGDGVTDSNVRNVGEGNFAIKSWGGSDSLPVNEIGSYKGNVVLDGPAFAQVESDGDWSIEGNG